MAQRMGIRVDAAMRYSVTVISLTFAAIALGSWHPSDDGDSAADKSSLHHADKSADKPESVQESALDDEPLLLLEEDPLLLDDEPSKSSGATASMTDNSRCHVCHLNFATEKIALIHARQKIGCADCHGDCDAHIDDESWASGGAGTPPDVMYPREQIDAACAKCHDSHDVPPRLVLQRWQERCPDRTKPSQITCTDCHGEHRVNPKLRKAWWDKKTGKPINKG